MIGHGGWGSKVIYWLVYCAHAVLTGSDLLIERPEENLNYGFFHKSGIFWERNSSEIDSWYLFYSGTSLKRVTTVESFEISNFFSPNFHGNGIQRVAQSIAGLRLRNASPPYIGIDGSTGARVSFFFFCFRLSVQVQVKGYDSFEMLPRLCGRPRDCWHAGSIGRRLVRSIPWVQKSVLAQRCTSTDRAETFSDQPPNPKESLDERPHFFRRITAPVVRPVDCRHARDRSAVALSDRHRGAKNACASSRINRSDWNFSKSFFEPQGCLGPTFTHFRPKIDSGRAPGSFPSERKPTFPWPILTNKAPIESSGIQLCCWLVSIEIELDAKAAQANTRTQVDCAMLMYALLCTGFHMVAIFFLTSL